MTPKQQRFAEEYVVDHNATQAAKRAGYSPKTAYSQGQRLLKNVEVIEAVRAKEARLRRKTEVSIRSMTEEMRENREIAIKNDQASAAVQATLGIAKLHGLLIDRKEIRKRPVEDMTLEQVQARIKEIEAELAEAGDDAVQAPTQH